VTSASAGSLCLIAVVPFVVRNRGYQWRQRRLVVLGVRLLLLVEETAVAMRSLIIRQVVGSGPHPPHAGELGLDRVGPLAPAGDCGWGSGDGELGV
jgi:hypothetical protein